MSKTENATEATREPPAVPAVGSQVDLVLGPRPPERAAFEAWLNPGHYADNISPWVAPGRYKSDRHQMAWIGWQAGVAAERERICAAIKAEDDHCADRDYMLDSDDCIAVARGQWKRPE